jgi:hypothetical protein
MSIVGILLVSVTSIGKGRSGDVDSEMEIGLDAVEFTQVPDDGLDGRPFELDEQPVTLGDLDDVEGRQRPPARIDRAQQGLGADHAAGAHFKFRLVAQRRIGRLDPLDQQKPDALVGLSLLGE